MASSVSHSVTANDVDHPFPRKPALKPQSPRLALQELLASLL